LTTATTTTNNTTNITTYTTTPLQRIATLNQLTIVALR